MPDFDSDAGTSEPVLITAVDDGVGVLTLNRPKAINALNADMFAVLERQLAAWVDDERVQEIQLRGNGERGYCAGADVRAHREAAISGHGSRFLHMEYRIDQLIIDYPKALTAYLHGISMGGGLGIALHQAGRIGGRRIAAPDLKLAMPEVGIGLWPDVGVCFELARMPGQTGTHVALTGTTIGAADALFGGLVDEVDGDVGSSQLADDQDWIDDCYTGDDPVAIVERLASHDAPRANQAAKLIGTRCPMSVWLALACIRRAAGCPDVASVLEFDGQLASRFMADPVDYIEGVRAQLVDKDRNPTWRHASVADVDPAEVSALTC